MVRSRFLSKEEIFDDINAYDVICLSIYCALINTIKRETNLSGKPCRVGPRTLIHNTSFSL
jgi:hypothetical protein